MKTFTEVEIVEIIRKEARDLSRRLDNGNQSDLMCSLVITNFSLDLIEKIRGQ